MRKAGFTAEHSPAPAPEPPSADEKPQSVFERIAGEVGRLVTEKNKAYGSAAIKAATFLELLFPDGVHPTRYADMLLLVRMFDKQMRIANRKDAFGESPYRDLGGYAVIGVAKEEHLEKGPAEETCPAPGERI